MTDSDSKSTDSKEPSNTRKLLYAALVALIAFGWIVYSYIYANQPNCPLCGDAQFVTFTVKIYEKDNKMDLYLVRLGPIGFCKHGDRFKGGPPGPHVCWYCYKHQKRIIKPANWRSE